MQAWKREARRREARRNAPRPLRVWRARIALPSLLLGAVLTQASRGQDAGQDASAKRSSTRGTVTTLAGQPWAGAKVEFWAMPLRNRSFGALDRVVAKSDARGRFRAKLRNDRIYSAIASASGGSVDKLRRSRVVQEVFARDMIRLVEEKARATPHEIRIESADGDITGLRVELLVAALNRRIVRAQHTGAGVFRVPCTPFPYFGVSVRNARGTLLARARLGESGRVPAKIEIKKARVLRILDSAGKELAARARIWSGLRIKEFARRSPLRWLGAEPIELDRSARGLLRIHPSTGQSHFLVQAEGFRSLKVALDGPKEVRMTPRAPMRIRLVSEVDGGLEPLAHARCFFVDPDVAAEPGREASAGAWLCDAGLRMRRTDKDGRVRWNSMRSNAIRLELENSAALRRVLALDSDQERIPIATLAAATLRGSKEILVALPKLAP